MLHAYHGHLITCSIKFPYTGWIAMDAGKEREGVGEEMRFDGYCYPKSIGFTTIAHRIASDYGSGNLFCSRLLPWHISISKE